MNHFNKNQEKDRGLADYFEEVFDHSIQQPQPIGADKKVDDTQAYHEMINCLTNKMGEYLLQSDSNAHQIF